MKIRDPKTGKVLCACMALFNYIRNSKQCILPCADCTTLTEKKCSIEWVSSHPAEAARLMGYEVIDDLSSDSTTGVDDTPTVSGDTPTEEDGMENMVEWKDGDRAVITGNHNSHNFKIGETVELLKQDHSVQDDVWICKNADGETWYVRAYDMKPVETAEPQEDVPEQEKHKLAEVLGVEEGEKWRYPGCAGLYRVHNGVREYWDENNGWLYCDCEEDLVKIIAHPESIIRSQLLTEPEIAIMRAMGAKWVSLQDGAIFAYLWKDQPTRYPNGVFADGLHVAAVDAALFPSVRPGDCVKAPEA